MCTFSRHNRGKEPPHFRDDILYQSTLHGCHLTGAELNKRAPTLTYDVSKYYRPVGLVSKEADRIAITGGQSEAT